MLIVTPFELRSVGLSYETRSNNMLQILRDHRSTLDRLNWVGKAEAKFMQEYEEAFTRVVRALSVLSWIGMQLTRAANTYLASDESAAGKVGVEISSVMGAEKGSASVTVYDEDGATQYGYEYTMMDNDVFTGTELPAEALRGQYVDQSSSVADVLPGDSGEMVEDTFDTVTENVGQAVDQAKEDIANHTVGGYTYNAPDGEAEAVTVGKVFRDIADTPVGNYIGEIREKMGAVLKLAEAYVATNILGFQMTDGKMESVTQAWETYTEPFGTPEWNPDNIDPWYFSDEACTPPPNVTHELHPPPTFEEEGDK